MAGEFRQPKGRKMRDFLKSFSADTRGGVLIYTAILMPVFLGFMALGLDIAAWHIEKRQSQTMADAAAVAAAIEDFIITEQGGTSPGCATGVVFDAAADAAGFNNFEAGAGHTLTLNCPATLGDSAGVTGSKEAIVSTPLPLFLASLVNVSVDGVSARSRAVAGASLGGSCLFALNEGSSSAITVTGNGSQVNVSCGVRSNSDNDRAITIGGQGAQLIADEILVTGGTDADQEGVGSSPTDGYSVEPTTGVNRAEDPLEDLPEPDSDSCTFTTPTNFTGNANGSMSPGVYCRDVRINTSGTVTLSPGIYVFKGVNFTVTRGTVIATGVMFFFTDSSSANSFSLSGGTFNLSAPTSGTYQGIAIYVDRDDSSYNLNLTGQTDVNLTGVIYAVNQNVHFSGGSSSAAAVYIIADEISVTGNSTVLTTDENGDPIFFSNFLVKGTLVE